MLRNKSNAYKRKRQELNDMTAEFQLLKRTEEILKEQVDQIKSRMVGQGKISMGNFRDFPRVRKNDDKGLKDIFPHKNDWKN